jgi:hypothetical protein
MRVGWEQAGIGDAAGEGQDVGLVQQLEKLADLAGADAIHARAEPFGPVDGLDGHDLESPKLK